MHFPFPGMDPYLEHPVLWEGFHARLIPAIADHLQPLLDPRHVATVEERVFVEGPQHRIPDVWIQRVEPEPSLSAEKEVQEEGGIVVEIEELEIHQKRVEILDANNEMKLVAIIEVVSPTNKRPGPGKDAYLEKQREILGRDCHLVEIDLLRQGDHVLAVPEWKVADFSPYAYLTCINRWPHRNRFVLHPTSLRARLPKLKVPLDEPDPDVILDLQAVVEKVWVDGRYARRIRYGEPCRPPLSSEDQDWASDRIAQTRIV